MGCLGDVHCPLKCVAIAARWSVSFLCVCKMFEEFYSGEHRLRQDISKTHRVSLTCLFFFFIQGNFLAGISSEVVTGSFGTHTNFAN